MENSFKTTEKASRKRKLVFLAIACIVLVFSIAALIQSPLHDGSHIDECTIYQIISEPACWENKTVKVEGTVEEILIGIIQPFNYWLCDKQNQTIRIGLRWHSDTNLSGKTLAVVGVVKRGYAWVNPNYPGWWTYYIEATSIYQSTF
jgi:hypothetical protein